MEKDGMEKQNGQGRKARKNLRCNDLSTAIN